MARPKCYRDLQFHETFEERFEYLNLAGYVGEQTFGFDRWVNQHFYKSRAWKEARDIAIVRDHGCDLGVPGYDIHTGLLVHHMNPLTPWDIDAGEEYIIDPEYLITTTHRTHNAIHYGNRNLLAQPPVVRRAGDTRLW